MKPTLTILAATLFLALIGQGAEKPNIILIMADDLGYDPKFNPSNQGFDEFRGFVSGNVDYHRHIDQSGLLPTLTKGDPMPERLLFWGAGKRWAVRSGKWKAVGEKNDVKLYDLEKDLRESKDVSAGNKDKKQELIDAYKAWIAEVTP